jgi:hypothetical protein
MATVDLTYRPTGRLLSLFAGLVVLGGCALVGGLVFDPQRTWAHLLLLSYYLIGIGLAGLLFVAFHYVTGARWSVPILRVPEAMTAVLPVAAVGIIAVLLCRPSLYSWSESAAGHQGESPLHRLWLNRPFFLGRALVYVVVWSAFAMAFLRRPRHRDAASSVPLSAAFLVVFGVTCWLASYDWIMSLEPAWASTIFGVYNFAGLFLSGLAALILLVIWLRRRGVFHDGVTQDHLHDLGTLLFSFSSFWMYTWFCQYMLIWYVNNPEETAYYQQRWQGTFPVYLFLNLALNWAIPFLVLLFRSAKRNPHVLAGVALLVLAGRWVDLYLMVLPSQKDVVATPGLLEAGLAVGMVGLFALAFFRSLGKATPVPSGSSVH